MLRVTAVDPDIGVSDAISYSIEGKLQYFFLLLACEW